MFSQNSWCFHVIPIFLRKWVNHFLLGSHEALFLANHHDAVQKTKRTRNLKGAVVGRIWKMTSWEPFSDYSITHLSDYHCEGIFCRCKAPNQLDFIYREYWGKTDPTERTLKAEYLLRLVVAGEFKETERTTQICLSHCWLSNGREDQRLATICWKWPLANSQQMNKDLSPTATRNWRLSITWSEPGSRFFPSLQTGAQPSQHLDFSLLRLYRETSQKSPYFWPKELWANKQVCANCQVCGNQPNKMKNKHYSI